MKCWTKEPIMQKILRIERYPVAPDAALAVATAWARHALLLLRQLGQIVNTWTIRHGSRRALAELERHHLRDIGKTAAQARDEAAKPFWRA
jgi:uncharacterized protein YjiS (DUF1127 family)